MKKLILLTFAIVVCGSAAQKSNNVNVKYKDFSLTFFSQPLTDSKVLPLIDAGIGKEQFGIHLAKTEATASVIEFLDEKGTLIKSLSMNDIVGKGVEKDEELLYVNPSIKSRRVANVYSVQTSIGGIQLILKAIATGNESSDDQKLVVTFAVKSERMLKAALRVMLPFTVNAEAVKGGIVITSKSGNGAIAASVFPASQKAIIEKNSVVIAGDPQTILASNETALLWLVIKAVSSSSSTDAKTQALKVIQDNTLGSDEARLVVVNTADKEKLARADTASYTIICTNIGTGEATDVVLGNPIPKGARYVEGSATTTGAVFNVEKDPAAQSGEGQSLKWMLSAPVKPGDERIVRFKVVVQ